MANPQGKAATLKMAELFDEWLGAQFTLGFLQKDTHHQARATVHWFLTGYKTLFSTKEQEINIIRPVPAPIRMIDIKTTIEIAHNSNPEGLRSGPLTWREYE